MAGRYDKTRENRAAVVATSAPSRATHDREYGALCYPKLSSRHGGFWPAVRIDYQIRLREAWIRLLISGELIAG